MHWTLVTMACLVAWALAGGLWRPGSLALAASWLLAQAWYAVSGESAPIWLYVLLDPLVLGASWLWRASWLDWIIIGIFPLEWVTYVLLEGTDQWWCLFFLAAAQMLCAGPWPKLQNTLSSVTHGPMRRVGV